MPASSFLPSEPDPSPASGTVALDPAAAAAFFSACWTAAMMPFDEYVAPETVSTLVDCVATMAPGICAQAQRNCASSSWLTRSTDAIFPPLIVTRTVTGPLYPSAEPSYVPSAKPFGAVTVDSTAAIAFPLFTVAPAASASGSGSCPVALSSAFLMAERRPREEYVAPETVSTLSVCCAMTVSTRPRTWPKYASSSPLETISMATILPPWMVTCTVMVPEKPVPDPV